MATTYNYVQDEDKVQKAKDNWNLFEKFLSELDPIILQLNSLLNKYNLTDKRISFPVKEGKITPSISYDELFFSSNAGEVK